MAKPKTPAPKLATKVESKLTFAKTKKQMTSDGCMPARKGK